MSVAPQSLDVLLLNRDRLTAKWTKDPFLPPLPQRAVALPPSPFHQFPARPRKTSPFAYSSYPCHPTPHQETLKCIRHIDCIKHDEFLRHELAGLPWLPLP